MFRLASGIVALVGLACLMGFAQEGKAQSYDVCGWQAQEIAQRNGGDQLTLTRGYSGGWDINNGGSSSYTYRRGNEVCSIYFRVYSTYFSGIRCSEENFWGGSGCYVPGKRTRHRR